MSNRRPVALLVALALTGVAGLVLAGWLDEHKGWSDPQQFIANISWIVMLLCVLGIVLTCGGLAVRSVRGRT